jgi:site-specific DNA recombinase
MAQAKPKLVTEIRAALYARYSSDIMNDESVERQFADLEKAAGKFGFKLDKRHYFFDKAQSGASLFDRPGLTRDLLNSAAKREFDVVLVEQTDRLARNKGDSFWLDDNLKFNNVKVFTPAGEVSDLQLMFESFANADFLKKLALRVKSGHDKIALKGLIPGPAAYGYDCVTLAGVKVINKEQSKIVIRIFNEYVSGKSPRAIAADLMRDKIPSPSGGQFWNFQSIVGGEGKKRGMLHNQLYIGVYLKNRFFNIKNPRTGKTVARRADLDDLITVQVPHLRIIDQELWNAAHALRKKRGNKKYASGQVQRAVVPRKKHLLAGLLRCAECNGGLVNVARDRNGLTRVACSIGHRGGACKHAKSYDLAKLTTESIFRMHKQLTDPDFLKEKAREKSLHLARKEKEDRGDRKTVQRDYDRVGIKIKQLVRALGEDDGDEMPKEIRAALKMAEIERRGLEEMLRQLGAEDNVTVLHPRTATAFIGDVETLHAMLQRNQNDPRGRVAFANLIDRILVHPTTYDAPYEISLYARKSAVGTNLFPRPRTTKEIVAAEGFPRTDRGGPGTSSTSSGFAPAFVAMQ